MKHAQIRFCGLSLYRPNLYVYRCLMWSDANGGNQKIELVDFSNLTLTSNKV